MSILPPRPLAGTEADATLRNAGTEAGATPPSWRNPPSLPYDAARLEIDDLDAAVGREVNNGSGREISVGDLAQTLIAMLEKDLHGLYHVVGAQAMNKYQFGVEVARKFGLRESLIVPQSVERSALTAKRSHNLWLSINKLSTDLGHEIPAFSTGLDGFYTQFQQGYPQKIRGYQQ